MTGSGVDQAWALLAGLDPAEVCVRTAATFETAAGRYALPSFGQIVHVSPVSRIVTSASPEGERLVSRFQHFSTLSILWYLIRARDIPPSQRLVGPADTQAGAIYFNGSHVLPLDRIATRYGNDRSGFLQKGEALKGEPMSFGDASLRLRPFPRLPVVLILREADDEFPASMDLLFDSTGEQQVPADILWSSAMLTLLMMQ